MLPTLLRCRVLVTAGSALRSPYFAPRVFHARVFPSIASRTFARSSVGPGLLYDRNQSYRGRRDSQRTRPRRDHPPSSTLFVGNIPFSAEKETIHEVFAEYGTIISVRIATLPSGETRGFAHIQFSDVDSAQRAMTASEEEEFVLDGRPLRLDWAAPMATTSLPPSTSLHFASYSGTEASLREKFADFDRAISQIRIVRDRENPESIRFGFIDCVSVGDAINIRNEFNAKDFREREELYLSFAKNRDMAPRFTSYGRDDGIRGTSRGTSHSDNEDFDSGNDLYTEIQRDAALRSQSEDFDSGDDMMARIERDAAPRSQR